MYVSEFAFGVRKTGDYRAPGVFENTLHDDFRPGDGFSRFEGCYEKCDCVFLFNCCQREVRHEKTDIIPVCRWTEGPVAQKVTTRLLQAGNGSQIISQVETEMGLSAAVAHR